MMSAAPELDPADDLALREGIEIRPDAAGHETVIIGSASLAEAVAARIGDGVRVFDDLVEQHAPSAASVRRLPLGADLFAGARLVIGRAPKALAELDEVAQTAAAVGASDIAIALGARVKHMSLGMNGVLERSFTEVTASRGERKSRVLRAAGPRPVKPRWPATRVEPAVGFAITAHGGAFAGTKLDIGTRALLGELNETLAAVPADGAVLDLGCGTGVLATRAALLRPDVRVFASDRSWAAAASTRLTSVGAGVQVDVRQEDAAVSIPRGSVDVVLLNPPFHDGHSVIDDMATTLFAAAARVLRPGGVLLTVYNSHLRHRAALERLVGTTTQLSRTPKFTVTRSVRRP